MFTLHKNIINFPWLASLLFHSFFELVLILFPRQLILRIFRKIPLPFSLHVPHQLVPMVRKHDGTKAEHGFTKLGISSEKFDVGMELVDCVSCSDPDTRPHEHGLVGLFGDLHVFLAAFFWEVHVLF